MRKKNLANMRDSVFIWTIVLGLLTIPRKSLKLLVFWEEWSSFLGLKENKNKTQFGAVSTQKQEKLKEIAPPNTVKSCVDVLGVSLSSAQNRKPTPKERQRQEDAMYVILRAGLLPVSRKIKHETIRSVAQTKATYGWISRKPNNKEVSRFDSKVWSACWEPYRGGTHHKRLLLGISLDGQVGIRQVCRSITAHIRNPLFLNRKSDKQAWSWLQKNGWISIGPLAWRHPSLKARLEPKKGWEKVDRKKAAHDLRESWRWVEWSRLTNQTTRHQVIEYQNEPFDAERLKLLRSEISSAQGPKRWLMLGAATSPLEHFRIFKSQNPHVNAMCTNPGCNHTEASWNHVMWECPYRPEVRQKSSSGLLNRYGWREHLTTEDLINSMTEAVEQMWQGRAACCAAE